MEGVVEAEDADAVLGRRVDLLAVDLGHLEQLAQAVAEALLALRVVGEAGEQAVGGEDGEAGVVEPGQRHQRVVVRALAADLVAEGARGLVAVVAVGDQQLGAGEALGDGGVDGRVLDLPEPVDGAVFVARFAPGLVRQARRDQRPGVLGREREDRREVVAAGAGQLEAVEQRAGMGALVGADGAALVVLDPDPGEDPVAAVAVAVGGDVVLGQRPERGRVVLDQRPVGFPALDPRRRLGVGIAARVAVGIGGVERFRQVDRDRVVGRALQQRLALGRVDHVIRRRRDRIQRADLPEVVVQRLERKHLRHRLQNLHLPKTGCGAAW